MNTAAVSAKPGSRSKIMYQVGTEGGFLPAIATHDNTMPLPTIAPQTANPDGPFNLLLAPVERADIVIDFNGVTPVKASSCTMIPWRHSRVATLGTAILPATRIRPTSAVRPVRCKAMGRTRAPC